MNYTHDTWYEMTTTPNGSPVDAYFALMFDVIEGTTGVELLTYRNDTFYGVPDGFEVFGWYPYNPPPPPKSEKEKLLGLGVGQPTNDNVVTLRPDPAPVDNQ